MIGLPLLTLVGASLAPTIELNEGVFVINEGDQQAVVQLPGPDDPLNDERMMIRFGDRFFVFDERGLVIRRGNVRGVSKLPDIAMTPKLFSQAEIDETYNLIQEGVRDEDVDALSGYELIGNDLYLLLRWEENDGEPWLETLVKIDIAAEEPRSELVGRFQGLSFASDLVEDRLFRRDGRLAAITQVRGDWGLSTIDPGRRAEPTFEPLGTGVEDVTYLPGQQELLLTWRSGHGTRLLGLLRQDDVEIPQPFAEIDGYAEPISADPPLIAIIEEGPDSIVNALTGRTIYIPEESGYADTRFGILVWTPKDDPRSAGLFDEDLLRAISAWSR
ncbi:MAG: hypothetical protein ACOCX1_01235 [Fimbriimonadaceae bacterium]